MLFKLALKNIQKSVKDYTIYFFTLIVGIAIFYVFNAMQDSSVVELLSASKRDIIDLLMELLGVISIFVSFILGGLVVYASRFLMKRRKKEFGIYMLLGMSKREIASILLWETIIIGFLSLVVGLLVGIGASQFMSVIVAGMFEVDMDQFTFSFSMQSFLKTIIYFGVIYLVVVLVYAFSISRTKLIALMQANKQNEVVKMRNAWVSLGLFLVAIGMLSYAYYSVTGNVYDTMMYASDLGLPILLGIVGTLLFFYSLSGFVLKVVQLKKGIYLKNINMFTVRQLHSKANTTVISMSMICLMLFLTICVLSSGLAMNNTVKNDLQKYAPVDVQLTIPRLGDTNPTETNFDYFFSKGNTNKDTFFKEYVEINTYHSDNVTYKETMPSLAKNENMTITNDLSEEILLVSQYNEVAKLYGNPTISLMEDEYLILCDISPFDTMRNEDLKKYNTLQIGGKTYRAKQRFCEKEGFLDLSQMAINTGLVIVPDSAVEGLRMHTKQLIGNYNAKNDEEIIQRDETLYTIQNEIRAEGGPNFLANTKSFIYEGSMGIGAITTFIGLYLGIIFLICSAAVLALKELSESSDNKERYTILRKIGVDEKMINRALFTQISIFFFAPLLLAIVHSIFGVKFATILLPMLFNSDLIYSILTTAAVLVFVYGGYFLVTYYSSKRIIR